MTEMEKSIPKQKFGCPKHGTGSLNLAHLLGGSGVFTSEHISLCRLSFTSRRWGEVEGGGGSVEERDRSDFVLYIWIILLMSFLALPRHRGSSLG